MKAAEVVAWATLVASSALAMAISVPRSTSLKVVGMEIHRREPSDFVQYDQNRLRRRQNTLELTLDNEETLYFANISLGTPAQTVKLHIDTGSSDLWVNTANSALCSRGSQCGGGTFDSSSSSTLKVVNSEFNISYVDGSGASGDYVTDTLAVGDVTVTDFQFGLGEISTSTEGILGIGYASNEVQVQRAGLNVYPNLPTALKDAGHISRTAYSLWLNDQESSTGTILFGGVNTAKYQGSLATVPVIQSAYGYSELIIALTGVSLDGAEITSSSFPAGALLDSGSTLTYLPTDITSAIYEKIGVTYDQQNAYGLVDCDLTNQSGTVEYSFSGITISVAYEELVIGSGGSSQRSGRGSQSCIFGIAPTDGTAVFGDTFLRSAYVVYDLENNQISLAQTVFNATNDAVAEIPSGTSLPPGATAVSNPVTSVNGISSGSSSAENILGGSSSGGVMLDRPLMSIYGLVSALVALVVL